MTPAAEQIENHMERATHGLMQGLEDANGMAREQMDAAMKSAAALSKGMEEIARNTSGLLQDSFSRSYAASKHMMEAKNLREIVDMQSELAKECFDCWVAGTGKISEISARMAQDVFGPLSEQANSHMQKMTHRARAI
ncbi:MAG: phasin family protein [Alphaproteobacteria bacterium]